MRTLIAAFALLFIVSGAVAADTVAELTRHSQALAATTEQRRSLSPASAAPEESLDRRGRAVVRLAREAEFYSQQARLLGDCLDASRAVQRSLAALREAPEPFPVEEALQAQRARSTTRLQLLLARTEKRANPVDLLEIQRTARLAALFDRELGAITGQKKAEQKERGRLLDLERRAHALEQRAAGEQDRFFWAQSVAAAAASQAAKHRATRPANSGSRRLGQVRKQTLRETIQIRVLPGRRY